MRNLVSKNYLVASLILLSLFDPECRFLVPFLEAPVAGEGVVKHMPRNSLQVHLHHLYIKHMLEIVVVSRKTVYCHVYWYVP